MLYLDATSTFRKSRQTPNNKLTFRPRELYELAGKIRIDIRATMVLMSEFGEATKKRKKHFKIFCQIYSYLDVKVVIIDTSATCT